MSEWLKTVDWTGEGLDLVFSLLGKVGRWLNVRGKRVCFIIWSIAVFYWAIRDITLGLYTQSIFCIASLALHIYGFLHWKKKRIGSD